MQSKYDQIYVIDLETTGLDGFPLDTIIEMALYRIDSELTHMKVFDTFIDYPKVENIGDIVENCWWGEQAKINYERDIKGSPTLPQVWKDLKEEVDNQPITSWNVGYDFGRFLSRINQADQVPSISWNILDCPMLSATEPVGIENYYGYKWPSLQEASWHYEQYLEGNGGFHRADYDTELSSMVIIEMIKRGDYKLKEGFEHWINGDGQ